MKISRDRFEELVSLYLDGEASKGELELLSLCVRVNPRMSAMFRNACRIHAATCRLYGREAHFAPLKGIGVPVFAHKRPSRGREAAEWTAVAALMTLCAGLMWFVLANGNAEISPVSHAVSAQFNTAVSQTAFGGNGEVFSVVKVYPALASE